VRSCSWTRPPLAARRAPTHHVHQAFDELRALFAPSRSRARGRTHPARLVQRAGGRCDGCEGAGHVLVEMVFLANVFVPARSRGKRFKKEVLEVKLGGSSIHDVLEGRWPGAAALSPPATAGPRPVAPATGRARLSAARPARDHAVGRRGAASEDRP